MRIVTVTKRNKSSVSKSINLNFINYLSTVHKDYYCVDLYHNHELLYTPKEFYNKFKPDVVICHEHEKCLDDGFFAEFPCTKIMIAVDFYKLLYFENEKHRKFYENNSFDLVFHRHWITKEEKEQIPAPTIGLPYAVDANSFYPIKFESKNNKIAFVGTREPKGFYGQRNEALRKINPELLKNYEIVKGKEYSKILKTHKLILNSSEFNSPFGKFFEIMASKSIPFNAPFGGAHKLFDEKFGIEYKKDCSNINDKLYENIFNDDKLKKMSNIAYEEFINKHTFDHRIGLLINNIKRIHKGKPLKRPGEK